MEKDLLLVNFGGPRNLEEIPAFLTELLTDRELIRTKLPNFLHNFLFRRVARKRVPKITEDYELIGGKSPIFEMTEALAESLGALTFHRYLPATHAASLERIAAHPRELLVLPLFPQFSYATTGSIASLLKERLPPAALAKLHWIKSYATHPAFISAWQTQIRNYLIQQNLSEQETILFFSAHGLPLSFIKGGDPYQQECEASYRLIVSAFPHALTKLAYQSKFGRGEWLKPYTEETCKEVLSWNAERSKIVFIPLAFTSDHIETLFEVEHLYLPLIRERGLTALRCPALNLEPFWLNALKQILQEPQLLPTQALLRTSSVA